MDGTSEDRLLTVFHEAACRAPAYRKLLAEAGIEPSQIKSIGDFSRLPVLDKHCTFERFHLAELCVDGRLGEVRWVLTSSGQSGVFSFGLYSPKGAKEYRDYIDYALDAIFQVSSRPTLLLNCLPMGVKLYSEHCTLGETSVREDMAVALVKKFGEYFEQIIFVGVDSFIKHTLELGQRQGVDWKGPLVHVIHGEELLAENARKCIEGILGAQTGKPQTGLVAASMGVGELGLNLFFEVPPQRALILLRRALHENPGLRREILGKDTTTAPAVFSYDPNRIYVEFAEADKLVITHLDPARPIPLVRYASDDQGQFLRLSDKVLSALSALGVPVDELEGLPIVAITGRGKSVSAGQARVFPEEVKEGVYHDPELAGMTTGNFRLLPGPKEATVRIQLSPEVQPTETLGRRFAEAVALYCRGPVRVTCEPYDSFRDGMALDYERKFDYLGR